MPLYEYRCQKCKKKFEILQKINSEPLSKCVYCKGPVKKLISLSSFQFKGSGWYITDYKDNNTKSKSSSTPGVKNKIPETKSDHSDKKDYKKVENKNVGSK